MKRGKSMNKIKVLDVQTANSIAAGEVVERPASVVKELCENALDAGAGNIKITIKNGGNSYLQVLDDGCGMTGEDAKLAFLPHATSKLSVISDLDSLDTMGFRGEALASIAAVAKVNLITRTADAPSAVTLQVDGGKWSEITPVGAPIGTCITVEDLFFNTPARFKFLKKDSTELNKIIDIVQKLALARPDVSFLLSTPERILLHTPGNNDLPSVVFSLFGKQTASELIALPELDMADNSPVKVSGLIGQPGAARSSRASQLVFVNNRPVHDIAVTKAIDEAYRDRLMKGKYPVVIIKLNLLPYLVDINVHPQKSEVRFWNSGTVFNSVYHTIKSALAEDVLPPGDWSDRTKPESAGKENRGGTTLPDSIDSCVAQRPAANYPVNKSFENVALNEPFAAIDADGDGHAATHAATQGQNEGEAMGVGLGSDAVCETVAGRESETELNPEAGRKPGTEPKPESEIAIADVSARTGEGGTIIGVDTKDVASRLPFLPLVGQVFNTYIILADHEELWLVDQHAAHEKVLFERFMQQLNERELRLQTLIPVPIRLNLDDKRMALNFRNDLADLGYEFDEFDGESLILRTVPACLLTNNPTEAFEAVLDYLRDEVKPNDKTWPEHQLYGFIATVACKAAIKGNDPLTEDEIKTLLQELAALKQPYNCPHGRPVIIRLSKQELEKRFKRII